jgi:hypothetical protein
MVSQRLVVSCREKSAFGNVVNSQLPKITSVHLGVKPFTGNTNVWIILPKRICLSLYSCLDIETLCLLEEIEAIYMHRLIARHSHYLTLGGPPQTVAYLACICGGEWCNNQKGLEYCSSK